MFLAGHGDPAQAERLLRTAYARPGATMQVRQNLALVLGLQGRFDEAETLARQDLPPDLVANNMAYLRAAAQGGAPARSWDAMRQPQ
jgi:Flp pilus assembly protein TadD